MKYNKNKSGWILTDQIGYIILALILIVILMYIIGILLGGEINDQGEKVKGVFDFLK